MTDKAQARMKHDRHETTAVIEIGDGTRRNALGRAEWRALERLVGELSADPTVSVIVVTGRGDTFSAGSDLNDWADASLEEVEQSFAEMEACFQIIERAPVPVIAAVDGVAAGAGCQLALACDLVVMSSSARMGMPIARLGILASTARDAAVPPCRYSSGRRSLPDRSAPDSRRVPRRGSRHPRGPSSGGPRRGYVSRGLHGRYPFCSTERGQGGAGICELGAPRILARDVAPRCRAVRVTRRLRARRARLPLGQAW
jgi:hypothetical protein